MTVTIMSITQSKWLENAVPNILNTFTFGKALSTWNHKHAFSMPSAFIVFFVSKKVVVSMWSWAFQCVQDLQGMRRIQCQCMQVCLINQLIVYVTSPKSWRQFWVKFFCFIDLPNDVCELKSILRQVDPLTPSNVDFWRVATRLPLVSCQFR